MAILEKYKPLVEQEQEFQPRYDLSPEQIRGLCAEFLDKQEKKLDTKFGCYIVQHSDKFSNLGRFVEATVFNDAFSNDAEVMRREYSPYEDSSTFFVVIDQEASLPVGVIRVLENSDAGLKSIVDLEKTALQLQAEEVYEKLNIDPDKCADVATLAILPEYRGGAANYIPSLLMYRTLYITTLNNPRFDHVVTVIDEKAERNLRTLKLPFKPIDSSYFSYLDSPKSRALYGVNSEFYPTVNEWQKKYAKEAEDEDSGSKRFLAVALDGLANGTHLDEMLGYDPNLFKH